MTPISSRGTFNSFSHQLTPGASVKNGPGPVCAGRWVPKYTDRAPAFQENSPLLEETGISNEKEIKAIGQGPVPPTKRT